MQLESRCPIGALTLHVDTPLGFEIGYPEKKQIITRIKYTVIDYNHYLGDIHGYPDIPN